MSEGKKKKKEKRILVCKYCGERVERLMIKAMLMELGCSVHPSADYCPDSPDHKHELVYVTVKGNES